MALAQAGRVNMNPLYIERHTHNDPQGTNRLGINHPINGPDNLQYSNEEIPYRPSDDSTYGNESGPKDGYEDGPTPGPGPDPGPGPGSA